MNNNMVTTDVAIIGAGPAGLFSAFQVGMLGLSSHIIDIQPHVGGQCATLYPEKPIYDIPGFVSINAQELVDRLKSQVEPFHPVYHLETKANDLTHSTNGRWLLTLASGIEINAAAVIIASGAGMLIPNRPSIPELDIYEDTSIHYSIQKKSLYEGKHVVIAGGGDSAADWAVELASIAASTTCIHRRAVWRASPHTQLQLSQVAADGHIRIVAPAQLVGLDGSEGILDSVSITENGSELTKIRCDHLFLFYGLTSRSGPFSKWGIHLQEGRISINAKTCATNLPGVFAVGDAAFFPGKPNLILSGFSEAALAARNAFKYCRPDEHLFIEHSTARSPKEFINEIKE